MDYGHLMPYSFYHSFRIKLEMRKEYVYICNALSNQDKGVPKKQGLRLYP